ncbi:peptidase [Acinetobacter sp. CFCC 10889]|uniref:peptidase n=1 Tax=Acinetobacter sp. CFCC 10889 TaxID=1775557 RepID=UPI000DCFC7A0|nr:peptidase [Acinetobacter sp. CFCC 10889]
MNTKLLVKISNIIGLVSIILLVYWVFSFVLIQVFGLKVFRQHMTETFLFSILGILALMGGALILNIMLNLTRIAERGQEVTTGKNTKKIMYSLFAVFPIIACILFGGNYLSAKKKQEIFVQSAENMIATQAARLQQLSQYQFSIPYIQKATQNIEFLGLLDRSFSEVEVIVPDQIQKNPIYLSFNQYNKLSSSDVNLTQQQVTALNQTNQAGLDQVFEIHEVLNAANSTWEKRSADKKNYVKQLNLAEKEYLNQVFQHNSKQIRFEAKNGSYELFYPYQYKNKTIVLYFTDRQSYGKLGS